MAVINLVPTIQLINEVGNRLVAIRREVERGAQADLAKIALLVGQAGARNKKAVTSLTNLRATR